MNKIANQKKSIYGMIGINKNNQIISYGEKTINQFISDEMLPNDVILTMNDVIENMDMFSSYTHYYKKINK